MQVAQKAQIGPAQEGVHDLLAGAEEAWDERAERERAERRFVVCGVFCFMYGVWGGNGVRDVRGGVVHSKNRVRCRGTSRPCALAVWSTYGLKGVQAAADVQLHACSACRAAIQECFDELRARVQWLAAGAQAV